MLTVGDQFPEFKLQAVVSLEDGREFEQVTNHTASGRWLVVFFWPMDFTFVCPTEIAEFGRRTSDFADRNAQVLGASTDTQYVHLAWRNALSHARGHQARAVERPWSAPPRGRGGAQGHFHRRSGGHDPLRERERSLRR